MEYFGLFSFMMVLFLMGKVNRLERILRDNGLGGGEEVKEGFGLRHMRERLERLGGSLTFGNREALEEDGERGFYLVVSLPIREKEDEVCSES